MESFTQLINEWEIQFLVLLSFTLQIFLFFCGGLRRYSTKMLLRVSIWLAYLGADFVAVYALGYLSRRIKDANEHTHLLTFFWAPFLLLHLGGQDTITAFALEDNNLWRRHLLTLIVQVSLALYVFWKTIGRHNLDLLVPGIFVFVSGIIKYGERTLSLMYGNLQITRDSTSEVREEDVPQENGYAGTVRFALLSAVYIRDIFAGSTVFQTRRKNYLDSLSGAHREWLGKQIEVLSPGRQPDMNPFYSDADKGRALKLMEVELGMLYDDIYTKAMVLRTRSGVVIRCISQVSAIIALVLFFLLGNKQRYSRADVAVTYVLLVGGIFLDVCAVLILMKSPCTWAWLKARRSHTLAWVSWFLFSSKIGWAGSKPLWSNSMGQYSLLPYLVKGYYSGVWYVFEKLMNLVGISRDKLLWIRKFDIKYMEVDPEVMRTVLTRSILLADEHVKHGQWPSLGVLSQNLRRRMNVLGFAQVIVDLYIFTGVQLERYEYKHVTTSQDVQGMVSACRTLSNYMMYLLATNPGMLPGRVDDVLQSATRGESLLYGLPPYTYLLADLLQSGTREESQYGLPLYYTYHDTLEKTRDMWILFLAYAAGKSRPDMHAAQLGKGGELITFLWLHMTKNGFGDSADTRIELLASGRVDDV